MCVYIYINPVFSWIPAFSSFWSTTVDVSGWPRSVTTGIQRNGLNSNSNCHLSMGVDYPCFQGLYTYIYMIYIYRERENFNIEKWEDKKQTHPCQIKAYAAKSSIEHRYVLNDLERGGGVRVVCSAQFRLQDQLRFMSMEHIFLKRDIRPAWIQLKWHEMTIHDRIETCWNMFMRNYHSIHEEILKDPRSFGKLRGAGTLASGGCQDRKSMLIKINTIYIYL